VKEPEYYYIVCKLNKGNEVNYNELAPKFYLHRKNALKDYEYQMRQNREHPMFKIIDNYENQKSFECADGIWAFSQQMFEDGMMEGIEDEDNQL
jgi:hypothetical protein